MTTRFGYPRLVLLADYARASTGLFFAAAIVYLPLHWVLTIIFAVIAALLLAFGLRTYLRQLSRIELSDTGIAIAGPLPRRIDWAELAGFRLRYFSMRRDRKRGWMELTLRGRTGTLSVESQIDGFPLIVERAARAAAGLELDEASLVNLAALGIARPKPGRHPP